jgi:DNA recombination protein RmuC
MENLVPIIALLIGLALGGVIVWLALRSRLATDIQSAVSEAKSEKDRFANQLASSQSQTNEFRTQLESLRTDIARLNDQLRSETERRAAAEQRNGRIAELEAELATSRTSFEEKLLAKDRRAQEVESEIGNLKAKLAESEARREEESKQADEKLVLLNKAREELTSQFENLANKILDEKSTKFTEQNKTNIDGLLKPLSEKIKEFEKKVDDTYDKESKQRFSLEKEIANLRDLNSRISKDAINLTNALKGKTKTQGNWGEQILETILQNAGLIRGQHYDVQVSISTDDGRRVQPDVILHLPEDRHIVIDSKVNLTAYTRYCELEEGPERDAELKKHVAAFRNHVSELSGKQYQDHYKLSSLEFVLMFVPLEPAFMLALQADESIYDFAFQKKISIVTPSTLHASVHTVSNIWRQDNQNKNAQKIAEEAGKLYDKFVAFTADLEDVGTKLQATQKSYDAAHNKLTLGRGNLIGRAENVRQLGAKTSKKLSTNLLDASAIEAEVNDEIADSQSASAD